MKNQDNIKDRYIQLVELFINALENGKTGLELEGIRKDIRAASAQLELNNSGESIAHIVELLPVKEPQEKNE